MAAAAADGDDRLKSRQKWIGKQTQQTATTTQTESVGGVPRGKQWGQRIEMAFAVIDGQTLITPTLRMAKSMPITTIAADGGGGQFVKLQ